MSPFLAGLSAALPASCLSSLPLLVAWWPRWWWVGSTQHQTSVSCHLTPFFFFFTYLQFTVPAVTSSIHPIDAHIERAKGLAWLDRIGGDAELDWTSRWMGLDVLILLLLLVLLFLFFFFSLYFPPCLLFIFFALLHTATTRYKGGWTWSLGWMLASVGPLVVAIWSFFL